MPAVVSDFCAEVVLATGATLDAAFSVDGFPVEDLAVVAFEVVLCSALSEDEPSAVADCLRFACSVWHSSRADWSSISSQFLLMCLMEVLVIFISGNSSLRLWFSFKIVVSFSISWNSDGRSIVVLAVAFSGAPAEPIDSEVREFGSLASMLICVCSAKHRLRSAAFDSFEHSPGLAFPASLCFVMSTLTELSESSAVLPCDLLAFASSLVEAESDLLDASADAESPAMSISTSVRELAVASAPFSSASASALDLDPNSKLELNIVLSPLLLAPFDSLGFVVVVAAFVELAFAVEDLAVEAFPVEALLEAAEVVDFLVEAFAVEALAVEDLTVEALLVDDFVVEDFIVDDLTVEDLAVVDVLEGFPVEALSVESFDVEVLDLGVAVDAFLVVDVLFLSNAFAVELFLPDVDLTVEPLEVELLLVEVVPFLVLAEAFAVVLRLAVAFSEALVVNLPDFGVDGD